MTIPLSVFAYEGGNTRCLGKGAPVRFKQDGNVLHVYFQGAVRLWLAALLFTKAGDNDIGKRIEMHSRWKNDYAATCAVQLTALTLGLGCACVSRHGMLHSIC